MLHKGYPKMETHSLMRDADGVALYRSIALEQIDHYVYQLLILPHKEQLDTICEGERLEAVISHLMY